MVYSLTYRRPPHVDSSRASLNGSEKTQSIGGSTINSEGSVSFGIPDALSFDRIITGGTCPVSLVSCPALLRQASSNLNTPSKLAPAAIGTLAIVSIEDLTDSDVLSHAPPETL